VTEQNKLTRSVLDAAPARAPFREALDRGLDFPKFGSPSLRGGRYYYSYNPGLANQASLFSVPTLETPHSEATLLIDPNTLSKDGTVALFDASFSEDGRHVSYQLSSGGSDWRTVKVMSLDPETGKGTPLPGDDLSFVKFSSEVWTKDNLGFFYSRYPPPPVSGNSSSNGTDLGTETDSATVRKREETFFFVFSTLFFGGRKRRKKLNLLLLPLPSSSSSPPPPPLHSINTTGPAALVPRRRHPAGQRRPRAVRPRTSRLVPRGHGRRCWRHPLCFDLAGDEPGEQALGRRPGRGASEGGQRRRRKGQGGAGLCSLGLQGRSRSRQEERQEQSAVSEPPAGQARRRL